MTSILKLSIVLFAFASTATYADNCEAIRAQIDAKIKAAGVSSYSVTIADSAAPTPGKIVGTCNKGANKIVYAQNKPAGTAAAPTQSSATPTPPPVKKKSQAILTECKDGSTPINGTCK